MKGPNSSLLQSQLMAVVFFAVLAAMCYASDPDYADALDKSILFFEGQRSGKLPANQRLTWRGDSGLSDGSSDHIMVGGPLKQMPFKAVEEVEEIAQVDLVGGYYDAGDNVKFGLPMAFTTTLLSWSIIEFGGLMPHQVENAREAVRWGTDYLLKAATATPNTLYVQVSKSNKSFQKLFSKAAGQRYQSAFHLLFWNFIQKLKCFCVHVSNAMQVGDANLDHKCWERPEGMDTPRTVYKVSSQNPGSDVAAETAAALAAASIVFKDSDPSYSSKLLQTAKKVFDFADRYRGAYSDSLNSAVCPFYCSYSGYQDELLWGASWLHRATEDTSYLSYIQSNGHTMGADDDDYSFSWDDKRAGTKVLLSSGFLQNRVEELHLYKTHSDNFFCSLIPGSPTFQAEYTPGGLLYKAAGSNLQSVTSTAFLLLTYANYLKLSGGQAACGTRIVTPQDLISLAKKQVDYILGQNPEKMSFMVGFGERYPQRIHHRGSSVPSVHTHPISIPCNDGFRYLYSSSPNPNILVGAVIGGPDNRDNFNDDRNNFQQSEPTTYINAPLVGALAFFAANSA
ncbi:Esterase/lipase/thioesterase [Asimina triloba]